MTFNRDGPIVPKNLALTCFAWPCQPFSWSNKQPNKTKHPAPSANPLHISLSRRAGSAHPPDMTRPDPTRHGPGRPKPTDLKPAPMPVGAVRHHRGHTLSFPFSTRTLIFDWGVEPRSAGTKETRPPYSTKWRTVRANPQDPGCPAGCADGEEILGFPDPLYYKMVDPRASRPCFTRCP